MTSEFGVRHRETVRHARKDHVCCECRKTIARGTDYHHLTAIWEDGPGTFKTCPPCHELRRWMVRDCFERGEEDWPSLGDLPSTVGEWLEVGRVFPEQHRAHVASIDVLRQEETEERSVNGLATVEETIQTGVG